MISFACVSSVVAGVDGSAWSVVGIQELYASGDCWCWLSIPVAVAEAMSKTEVLTTLVSIV